MASTTERARMGRRGETAMFWATERTTAPVGAVPAVDRMERNPPASDRAAGAMKTLARMTAPTSDRAMGTSALRAVWPSRRALRRLRLLGFSVFPSDLPTRHTPRREVRAGPWLNESHPFGVSGRQRGPGLKVPARTRFPLDAPLPGRTSGGEAVDDLVHAVVHRRKHLLDGARKNGHDRP